MKSEVYKKFTNSTRRRSIAAFCLLIFLTTLSVSAADTESISALRQMGKAFSTIAGKASPAVVSLKVKRPSSREYRRSPYRSPFEDDIFEFFRRRSPQPRSPRQEPMEQAQGTGFIISSDGYIFTNNHMVGGAKEIEIGLSDGRKFEAEIIGTDETTDIAVIKIDAKNLPHLKLGDSDTLEVGEWVLAIGNPLGLSHTVTAGIVSAKGRGQLGLASIENFIQTDAAINFGNSGGPLLNLDGKVVGMNTAIVGATGNIGIGFAIPINMIKRDYEQLLAGGKIERGFLGIRFDELTPAMAASLGLDKDTKGVTVVNVEPDSAAEKAGLERYDVITELDGEPVIRGNDFLNRVAILNPGTKVKMVVLRDGKPTNFTVKLGKRPSDAEIAGGLPSEMQEELGFTVETLTPDMAKSVGYDGETGVIVTSVVPGSEASELLITQGALIKEVNREKVRNKEEFYDAIKKARKRGGALLLVQRGSNTFFAILTLSK